MKFVLMDKIAHSKILVEFYICQKFFVYSNMMKIVNLFKMMKNLHMIMKENLMKCAYMKNFGFCYVIKIKK